MAQWGAPGAGAAVEPRIAELRAQLVPPGAQRYWGGHATALPARQRLDLAVAARFHGWFRYAGRDSEWPVGEDETGATLRRANTLRAALDAVCDVINYTLCHAPTRWVAGAANAALRQACAVFINVALCDDTARAADGVHRLVPQLALPDETRLRTLTRTLPALRWPLTTDARYAMAQSRTGESDGLLSSISRAIRDEDALAHALCAHDDDLNDVLRVLPADASAALTLAAFAGRGFHVRLWLGALTDYLLRDPHALLWQTLGSALEASSPPSSDDSVEEAPLSDDDDADDEGNAHDRHFYPLLPVLGAVHAAQ